MTFFTAIRFSMCLSLPTPSLLSFCRDPLLQPLSTSTSSTTWELPVEVHVGHWASLAALCLKVSYIDCNAPG